MNDSAGGTASGCAVTFEPGTLKNYRKHGALPHTPGEGLLFFLGDMAGGEPLRRQRGGCKPHGGRGAQPHAWEPPAGGGAERWGVSFTPLAKPRGGLLFVLARPDSAIKARAVPRRI